MGPEARQENKAVFTFLAWETGIIHWNWNVAAKKNGLSDRLEGCFMNAEYEVPVRDPTALNIKVCGTQN